MINIPDNFRMDGSSQVDKAILLCGGYIQLSEILGVKFSTIATWMVKKKGVIPTKYLRLLKDYATRENKFIDVTDFI